MAEQPHLLIDRPRPEIGRLTINRPERRNALTRELVRDISEALAALGRDPECRVVILGGAGKGFCSGQDMQAASTRTGQSASGMVEKMFWQEQFAGMVLGMRRLRQPVIAAVNGAAAGAGMALALGADIRVASHSARFLVAAIRIGLSAGESGISYHLPRLIGAGRAFEVLLTGRPIEAEEAARIGLVTRLVADEALADAAIEQALAISRNAPFAVEQSKKLMWRTLDAASLDEALALENSTQIVCATTEDYREATRAFVEKRDPAFTGR